MVKYLQPTLAFAPARISLVGGGTDLADYYQRKTGRVLSFAISSGVRAGVTLLPETDLRIMHLANLQQDLWFRRGEALPEGGAYLAALAVETWAGKNGCEVTINADFPPGTGLGGSGAMCVALYCAFHALRGGKLNKKHIAHQASQMEIERAGRPIGLQDQYASALGGFNLLSFGKWGNVVAQPLILDPPIRQELIDHFTLFYQGVQRDSGTVLSQQKAATAQGEENTLYRLDRLAEMAKVMRAALLAKKYASVGNLLDEAWQLKRGVAEGISDENVDNALVAAKQAGAWGGKVCGAGAGGHLLIMSPPRHRTEIINALELQGWQRREFTIDSEGVRLLEETNA